MSEENSLREGKGRQKLTFSFISRVKGGGGGAPPKKKSNAARRMLRPLIASVKKGREEYRDAERYVLKGKLLQIGAGKGKDPPQRGRKEEKIEKERRGEKGKTDFNTLSNRKHGENLIPSTD